MDNITITRYDSPNDVAGYVGYIEPKDLSWILYIDKDGNPEFYPNRDKDCALLPPHPKD